MFKTEEAQALLAFLGRCNLNGNEAETMVYLKNKIKEMTAKEEAEPEKK